MSVELLRFEQPPETPASDQEVSLAAGKVIRPTSAATGLRALPSSLKAVGVGAVQGVGALIRRASPTKSSEIAVLEPGHASSFIDGTGARIRKGVIYARHPKTAKENTVISAPQFHQHIIKEQIAEIVRYLRSELLMKSVKIIVRSEKSGKVLVGSSLRGVPVLVRLGIQNEQSITLEQTSHRPTRVRSREPYVWLDDFPEITAAAKAARHGSFLATQSSDLRFGLSLPLAKIAGIDAEWLSTFSFTVEASYD